KANEVIALERLARLLERHERARILAERALNERVRDEIGRGERDSLLEKVEELPDVARPRRTDQEGHCSRRKGRYGALVALGETAKEMCREERNVLAPVGQRRQFER